MTYSRPLGNLEKNKWVLIKPQYDLNLISRIPPDVEWVFIGEQMLPNLKLGIRYRPDKTPSLVADLRRISGVAIGGFDDQQYSILYREEMLKEGSLDFIAASLPGKRQLQMPPNSRRIWNNFQTYLSRSDKPSYR